MFSGRRGDQRGSVTLELAAALPVLVVLLAVAVGSVRVVTAELACTDAAREAARTLARGEPPARARQLAGSVAPPGAAVQLTVDGDLAIAVVAARVRTAGPLLPAVTVTGRAVAAQEPGPADAPAG